MSSEQEIAFPRGHSSSTKKEEASSKKNKKRPSEHQTAPSSSATSDILFGDKTSPKETSASKKRRKSSTSTPSTVSATSFLPLGGGAVVQPSARSNKKHDAPLIEALSFNKLAKGTKLLACVKQVADDYILMSLPNLLTGYILKKVRIE